MGGKADHFRGVVTRLLEHSDGGTGQGGGDATGQEGDAMVIDDDDDNGGGRGAGRGSFWVSKAWVQGERKTKKPATAAHRMGSAGS